MLCSAQTGSGEYRQSALNKGQLCCQHNFIQMKTNLSHTKTSVPANPCREQENPLIACCFPPKAGGDLQGRPSPSWWEPLSWMASPHSCGDELGGQGCCCRGAIPAACHRLWGEGTAGSSVSAWLMPVTWGPSGTQVEMDPRFCSRCAVLLS